MFSTTRKFLFIPLLSVLALAANLTNGFFQPAYCESQPRAAFYAYIRSLYYATKVKQVSKFWIKNARVPMEDKLGTAEVAEMARLKKGYIANPQIQTEVLDGNICKMQGVGLGWAEGQRLQAKLAVIMRFEEGAWKIQDYAWSGEIRGGLPGH